MIKIPLKSVNVIWEFQTCALYTSGDTTPYIEVTDEERCSLHICLNDGTNLNFMATCEMFPINDGKICTYAYLVNNWVNYGELAMCWQTVVTRSSRVKYVYRITECL